MQGINITSTIPTLFTNSRELLVKNKNKVNLLAQHCRQADSLSSYQGSSLTPCGHKKQVDYTHHSWEKGMSCLSALRKTSQWALPCQRKSLPTSKLLWSAGIVPLLAIQCHLMPREVTENLDDQTCGASIQEGPQGRGSKLQPHLPAASGEKSAARHPNKMAHVPPQESVFS